MKIRFRALWDARAETTQHASKKRVYLERVCLLPHQHHPQFWQQNQTYESLLINMPSSVPPEGAGTLNQDIMEVETETKDDSHTAPDPILAEADEDHGDSDAMDEDLPMVNTEEKEEDAGGKKEDAKEKKEDDEQKNAAIVKPGMAPDSQEVKLEDLFAGDDSDYEFPSGTGPDIKISSSPPEAPASPM